MNQREAYTLLCKEYLDKVKEFGCDACVAEYYCIEHGLRNQEADCVETLKEYFRKK